MPRRTCTQLALGITGDEARTVRVFVPTAPLRRHRHYNVLLRKLHYVRRFFPELANRPLRVGLTRAASGMAVPGGDEIWLNPARLSLHTIAHELVHLLQGRHGIPAGERSCDLFALARHWTLIDTAPYYVRVPGAVVDEHGMVRFPRLVHDTAVEAVEMRQSGTRNYIAYFERTLEELVRTPRPKLFDAARNRPSPATGE